LSITKELFLSSVFASNLTNLIYKKTFKKTFLIPEKVSYEFPSLDSDFQGIPFAYTNQTDKNFLFFIFKKEQLKNLLTIFNIETKDFFSTLADSLNNLSYINCSFNPQIKAVDMPLLFKQKNKFMVITYSLSVEKEIFQYLILQLIPLNLVKKVISLKFPTAYIIQNNNIISCVDDIIKEIIKIKSHSISFKEYISSLETQDMQKFIYLMFADGLKEKDLLNIFNNLEPAIKEKIRQSVSKNLRIALDDQQT
jgi:hypothetical protein